MLLPFLHAIKSLLPSIFLPSFDAIKTFFSIILPNNSATQTFFSKYLHTVDVDSVTIVPYVEFGFVFFAISIPNFSYAFYNLISILLPAFDAFQDKLSMILHVLVVAMPTFSSICANFKLKHIMSLSAELPDVNFD
jgi:hypothetical protein